ncbi:hypothetical protein SDC9_157489 [bioreactor metagenome]|uniref:Uncharacterized protein n=1 Tax=bioreactor metagenome TaxID=1076179 RepID=A0A645FCA2_9ZZZZ
MKAKKEKSKNRPSKKNRGWGEPPTWVKADDMRYIKF